MICFVRQRNRMAWRESEQQWNNCEVQSCVPPSPPLPGGDMEGRERQRAVCRFNSGTLHQQRCEKYFLKGR